MLWAIFFFVVLVVMEYHFPSDDYYDDQDWKNYFFDEFIDEGEDDEKKL